MPGSTTWLAPGFTQGPPEPKHGPDLLQAGPYKENR